MDPSYATYLSVHPQWCSGFRVSGLGFGGEQYQLMIATQHAAAMRQDLGFRM